MQINIAQSILAATLFHNCQQMWYIINRGPGFLAVVWFGSFARPPLSPISCQQVVVVSFLVFLCIADRDYWRERGGRGGRGAESFDQQGSLALFKLSNTLCLVAILSHTPLPTRCFVTNAKRGNLWRLWHNILEKVGFSIARNVPEQNVPIIASFFNFS